ncbi:ATP-binding cassette domain-containing protein [Scytonema sp. UIC 10036]|uniref:ABC transporter ATP-binding protein n=1 Tax=Scytonema sp. UIC 10036 TaxID=2304196 RepID=UPI0012DA8990|nr:ABC transporter ATP-binding protein [Scytonema sp. UIC 10036]MUH01596.1 ATP-binding cassette domain-containing protein [Scytonema sp. UIC 10036]
MSDSVIRVENLSKKYILGQQEQGVYTYKTFRGAMTNMAKSLANVVNPRAKREASQKQEFWALNDVSFEIKQGERVGIVGRNGAGKSTLLKILSRITEPTKGRIQIKGRVASLLEVGTGFHPELTGRENIFLNGAILGMSKVEIQRKFDEIVEFAEIEKFLDTPVKRYSSGMYVRLAFAVAAHLDPEILIVDEVLAVGDAQFQKKCLGKMQEVSEDQGRTVLFVSHNMDAIQRLCSQCIMLERGRLLAQSDTDSIVIRYLSSNSFKAQPKQWIDVSKSSRIGSKEARFVKVQYSSLNAVVEFQSYSNGPLEFVVAIESDSTRNVGSLGITLCDQFGNKLVNADSLELGEIINLKKGENLVTVRIEKLYLKPGNYTVALWLADPLVNHIFDYIEAAFELEVINLKFDSLGMRPQGDGVVLCDFEVLQMSHTVRID